MRAKRLYCLIVTVLYLQFGFSRCKQFVQVPAPNTVLTSGNVYNNNATAVAVLTGIYETMVNTSFINGTSINSISLVAGLSADELSLFGGPSNSHQLLAQYYLYTLNAGIATGSPTIWNDLYSKIYVVNIAIENLSKSTDLTSAVKMQLLGEARFLRAFFYFYLVNLYGNVPVATTSDYRVNSTLGRSMEGSIFAQIVSDLSSARQLLSNNFVGSDAVSSSLERVRPSKWAASALLARVYLYEGKYDSAELETNVVIGNSSLFRLSSLNTVFLKNSSEAIWQLQPINVGWNTEDARVFILPSSGPTGGGNYPVYLNNNLIASFEAGDQRRLCWVDSILVNGTAYYFPYKYKSASLNASISEYEMVLRLGEQYLIRAEAKANQNNLLGAKNDLDTIRYRAGLSSIGTSDKTMLLNAIEHERRIELFSEWGHRWLDLKRLDSFNGTMSAVALEKNTFWNDNWKLYPIPLYDIIQDPNLGQNPGY